MLSEHASYSHPSDDGNHGTDWRTASRSTLVAAAQANGSTAPLRVAFIVHVMQVAGAEVLVAETIRHLGRRISPTIICLDAIGTLGQQLQDEGVEVISLDRRAGRDWRVAWRMAKLFRGRRIEVAHAHQYTPFFYAALARLLSGSLPRLILTEHGRHYPDLVSPLRRALNRLVFDRVADAVNAVCTFSARSLSRKDGFAGPRIEIIENGIVLDRYQTATDRRALRQRLDLEQERRYVVNVARFHPVKDHAMLLQAFSRVAALRDDVDLLLAGDGPLRPNLERLIHELDLAGRVRLLGVRADVPDILQAAEVFVLTSLSEAASLTLLEAMAAGLPVVVTAVGGNPEIVRHQREGLLVPRGDAQATADAILHLLDHPQHAATLGAAARARVHERYQLARTIDAYYRLYERLAGRLVDHRQVESGSRA